MNDVWFGPGRTHDDYSALLEALGLDPRKGAPLLAAATRDNETARLVMASRAFFDLFAVNGGDALSRRLLAGADPGARRLADLVASLPLQGAPRLERLRFMLGPGNEVMTFLCRRTTLKSGLPVFVAAALGVPRGLMTASSSPTASATSGPLVDTPAEEDEGAGETPVTLEGAQATLQARFPAARRVRFVWQTNADAMCVNVSAPLALVVGQANADLVGKNMRDIAPRLDPSGRLEDALARRETWSGIDVDWPIDEVPGAVAVALGAVAAFDRDRVFEGFRGYGVIHLDKLVARQPLRLVPAPQAPNTLNNVVPFPGQQRGFSAEDQIAFAALGAELRDRAGIEAQEEPASAGSAAADAHGHAAPEVPDAENVAMPGEAAASTPMTAATAPGEIADEPRTSESARPGAAEAPTVAPSVTRRGNPAGDGFALLDRLALGLLVSRDNVPIFANRKLLDMLGFADEDELHEAGGLTHLFGGQPSEAGETVGVRDRDGTVISTTRRLQRITWDGLPATLLTLQPVADAGPADNLEAEHEAAIEAMGRQHAEERRRDDGELRRLRAILETATDGVAVIDDHGNVLSLNRSGEALFGCDRGAVVGKPFLELFAPDTQGPARDYLDGITTNATKSLLNDGRELLVKAPKGGTIPVFMTLGRLDRAEPATDHPETGGKARFCALFRDLTHWKKVETELEAAKNNAETASAAKTDFLAKISHEVRTPLNAIIGFAEVILEERFGPVGNERYKEYLRDIHTSGTHVMSLVNDLLDLSKIEAGRMELKPTPIDANKVITECVSLMQPQASRERVIMRLSLAPTLPMIRADERSLRQILLNLLSNAVKFNEPGGQVIVATAAPEDGKVVIRIRDTGAGMSETDIAAALEPFRRVSTRPMAEGTGLGLPLTKALVEANEATFMIRSKLDQGTLIEVAFPPARVLATQR